MSDDLDIAEQALAAKEQGLAEIIRLLQHPEDLAKLGDITAEYESRHRSAKATLTAMVQSQVESARLGMELLERSQRHIAKLQAALDRIDRLCAECSELVSHHDKIKLLATTHGNVKKVLSEIEDIVDLPYRADRCWEMLEGDEGALVPAFEALSLLTGTARNAKLAWQRNNKSASEVSELTAYLSRVDEVMGRFEERLFGAYLALPGLIDTARQRPALLVDCVRVVELQELLDAEYARVTMGPSASLAPPRRYRARLFAGLTRGAQERFEPLLEMARACNAPNATRKYDAEGDLVVSEQRDYLGALTRLVRVREGAEEVVVDPEELRGIQVFEEDVFDEAAYLDDLLSYLYDMTDELAAAYDYAAPCCPPDYDLFNRLFQAYHVQFAAVVDELGHRAAQGLSTQGALRVMDWVQKYMDTLRNLGVEEELVRLPPSPLADPDSLPGMVVLMESYVGRMESTVTAWYRNILDADLQGEPKVSADGTLGTLGVVEFFRILAQQIGLIEAMNDHGEVMFTTARTALGLMRGFQDCLLEVLGADTDRDRERDGEGGGLAPAGLRPGAGRPMSLEMAVAFVNNALSCYDQSLAFAEDVQRQLDKRYREQLDVEDVCRGFLEVAKAASQRAVYIMFNDPGMSGTIKGMYGNDNAEYLSGRVTATLVATLRDYFSDFRTWVAPHFLKRLAEAALGELVRRAAGMWAVAPPTATEALLTRMSADVSDLSDYFGPLVKADRMRRQLGLLSDMRELLAADGPETFALAYSNLLSQLPALFPLELATKVVASCRPDLTRKQVSEITAQCKELWKQREAARKAAAGGGEGDEAGGWGFFGWGKKS